MRIESEDISILGGQEEQVARACRSTDPSQVDRSAIGDSRQINLKSLL
jgi:hypothetical protein